MSAGTPTPGGGAPAGLDGRSTYRRMGTASAEYRRQERLLLGRPAWAIRREQQRADAVLFGRRS